MLKMLENFQRQISSKLLKILLAENIPEVGFLVDKGFASLELALTRNKTLIMWRRMHILMVIISSLATVVIGGCTGAFFIQLQTESGAAFLHYQQSLEKLSNLERNLNHEPKNAAELSS